MISDYPTYTDALSFAVEEERMQKLIEAIRAIRNRRAEMNVPPSKKAHVIIVTANTAIFNAETARFFEKLASASEVTVADSYSDENAVQIVTDSATIYIPLAEVLDFDKELERLNKEYTKIQGEIDRLDKKLSNAGFVAKAPAQVVEAEKVKLAQYKAQLDGIAEAKAKLENAHK